MKWFSIQGFQKLYEVSESGDVRNARSHRLIPRKSGAYTLCVNGVPIRIKASDIQPVEHSEPEGPIHIIRTHNTTLEKIQAYPWWTQGASYHSYLGDAGESLVCVELLVRGIKAACNIMAGAPYDIVADFGRGIVFTIQVKTTSGPCSSKNSRTPGYRFSSTANSKNACDIFAYVAMDNRRVVFEMADRLTDSHSRGFSVDDFNRRSITSLDEVLLKMYDRVSELPDWMKQPL